MARQRSAERVALRRVDPSFVKRGLCRRNALQADERATEVESLHHLDKAGALCAEPVRPWHLNFVEKNRPAPHRFAAEIVELAGSHASRVHGHEESTDAARTVFGATGTGEYQDRIGLIGNADRGFLAIEHITRVDLTVPTKQDWRRLIHRVAR